MGDSVTLAGVETVALAEGVKFPYGQVGEALRRWRERRSSASPRSSVEEPVDIELLLMLSTAKCKTRGCILTRWSNFSPICAT